VFKVRVRADISVRDWYRRYPRSKFILELVLLYWNWNYKSQSCNKSLAIEASGFSVNLRQI